MVNFLTEDEKKCVSASVAAAELKTSGEIVPMIVRRSSMIGHVFPQLFSLLIIFTLFFRIFLEQYYHELHYDWIMLAGLMMSAPMAFWLQRFSWVQRVMTPVLDREFEVFERAKLEFYESNIHKTKGDTGILIFISLMEHQCVVLAGESIASKMPKDTWDKVVGLAVGGIKNKKAADGLVAAIELCGQILSEHFPVQNGDKNELPNAVVLKE